MNKNQKGTKKQAIPVILSPGFPAMIIPNEISQDKWTHHHGKTATGQQVNSLQSVCIGDSLLIRKNIGGPTLSVSQAEFEVAAVQILSGMGYKMQAPAGI